MSKVFHWLPCVRSSPAKGNDSSVANAPESSKPRPPAPHKGEKFNTKNHGWRSWGKSSAQILKPESEDKRRDINEDMVKAIGEYMAQRPFQYKRKDEPEDQQKQQGTALVKEMPVKTQSKPLLPSKTVEIEEAAEEGHTSFPFVPEPIAEIQSTKTHPSAQTVCRNCSCPKSVQNSSTSTVQLYKPTFHSCTINSSTSIILQPAGEWTEYAVISRDTPSFLRESATTNRSMQTTSSASGPKSVDVKETASASACATPSTTPKHTSVREHTAPVAQSSALLPRQPFLEKPLFTKNTASYAERTPYLQEEERSSVTVIKDFRPTISVIIDPPLGSNTSVIKDSERFSDTKSRNRIFIPTGKGPRPMLSVVVNPPLHKSFASSKNELNVGALAGKSSIVEKQHMLTSGVSSYHSMKPGQTSQPVYEVKMSESRNSHKNKSELFKEPLGVSRSESWRKQHSIEKNPSPNNKQTSTKTRTESLVNTPIKSRSAISDDGDTGMKTSKGQVHKEKSKESGCGRPSHRY